MFKVYRVPSDLAQCPLQPVVLPLIQRLHQIILHSTQPDQRPIKVAQAIVDAFQADAGLLVTQTESQGNLQVLGWSPDHDPLYLVDPIPELKELWPLLALQSGKVLLVDSADVLGAEPGHTKPASGSEVSHLDRLLCLGTHSLLNRWQLPAAQSILAFTFGDQHHIQGVMVLLKQTRSAWSSIAPDEFQALTDLTAIALVQAHQMRHMQTLQRDVFLAQQYQNLSHNVLGNLHRTLAQEELVRQSLQTTGQTLQAERGFLLLLKYESPALKFDPAGVLPKAKVILSQEWCDPALPPELSSRLSSRLGQSSAPWFWLSDCELCQQVLTGFNQTLTITDLELEPTWLNREISTVFSRNVFSSLLIAPLLAPVNTPVNTAINTPSPSPILGFWVLQHRQPRVWNIIEQQFAESIAALVSSVIIHNQALRQVQTLVEERTAQLEQNQRIQTKLYEITRQQVEQLRQLNQLKDEFLDTLSHELRTPLTSMKMAITMLRQPGMLSERAAKYIDVLEQEWTRENNLIKDLLLLQELEASTGMTTTQRVAVETLIQDVQAELEPRWQTKQIQFQIESFSTIPTIITDPQSLKRVVLELLTNAGKFSRSQTTIRVHLSTETSPTGETVRMDILNQGIGITTSELGVIFDKFRRGQGVTQQAIPGVGLGLALVKCFLKQLQGSIDVSSQPISEPESLWETCFTIRLPLYPAEDAVTP